MGRSSGFTTSVAIPCFNGAGFLARTIEALLAQTHAANEILVVDDGSTDESAAIAGAYPVRLIRHPRNQGLSASRNSAIAAATGEIIAFVDVDAWAEPEWLASLLAGYEDAGVDGVGGAGIEANIRTDADRWRRHHASQNHGSAPLEQVDFLFGLNMSYRRQVLLEAGGFDPALRTNAEDLDMGYRLTRMGRRLVYRPAARVLHQRQDDAASLNRAIYNWYYWAFVVKRRNGRNPWRLALGTARRLLWSDLPPDLLVRRDLTLARLDCQLSWTKLRALRQAAGAPPAEPRRASLASASRENTPTTQMRSHP